MNSTSPIPLPARAKKPFLAAIWSLLLPGVGQIYCAQDNKGVFLFGMSLLGHWSTGGISSWLLFPAAALDAFVIAKKINRAGMVGRWEFFPSIPILKDIPPRIILLGIALWIAALTVMNVRHFAAD